MSYEFSEVERAAEHYEYIRALERVAVAAERVASVKQPTSGALGVALTKLDFALDALNKVVTSA